MPFSMKITISIICYNYARFLPQAINSALMQNTSGVEIEVMVINDGSSDNTLGVCSHYGDSIKVISEGNHGFASSLSRSIRHASGSIVFLMDADDYFMPDKVSTFIPYFRPGIHLVYDKVNMIQESNTYYHSTVKPGGSTSTIAVNRESALDLFPIENELSFHVFEDMGLAVRLSHPYTCYRLHSLSMTDRSNAGAQNLYLSGVTLRLSDTLLVLALSDCLPPWVKSRIHLLRVAFSYRSKGYYNILEASLEVGKPLLSAYALVLMLLYALIGSRSLSLFDFKMIVKTFFMRPSFPKSAINPTMTCGVGPKGYIENSGDY